MLLLSIFLRPVKPISLYGLFFRETYPKVKLSFPSAKFGDISREVSHRWELLCSHEKSKYKRRIEGAKREYKQDLENYKKSLISGTAVPFDPRGKIFHTTYIIPSRLFKVYFVFTIKVYNLHKSHFSNGFDRILPKRNFSE